MAGESQQAQAVSFVTSYVLSSDSHTPNTTKATSAFAKLYDANFSQLDGTTMRVEHVEVPGFESLVVGWLLKS